MTPPRSAFVNRLAYALIALTLLYAVLLAMGEVRIHPQSLADAPGAESAEDVATLERLAKGLIVFLVLWIGFLLLTAWSLLRRCHWARRVVMVLLGLCIPAAIWAGIVAFAGASGRLGAPDLSLAADGLRVLTQIVFATVGLICFAIGWGCWRLISRLHSPEIRSEFR